MTASPILRLDTKEAGFEAAFGRLERRRNESKSDVEQIVGRIVADVRDRGDAAVIDAIERHEGYRPAPGDLEVARAEIDAAPDRLDSADLAAFELASERIRAFHEHRVPESWSFESEGAVLGQRMKPLARVAVYAPAAKAPLASSVLMLAVPAAAAGVGEIVMASPGRDSHPAMLAVAKLCGVARVFRIGGAEAMAALAYGTETVPRVDKIVGPGNVWGQTAKRMVFGEVAIDSEAGPSEVFIVADSSAPAELVAADLLAQAEHEELASVVLGTPDAALADAVIVEIERQLAGMPREDIARQSLGDRSAVIATRDLDEAFDLANRYAAEHLQLLIEEPRRWLDRVESAGAIFLGLHSPVPLGDYVAGPSHVLPTGGTARFFSPVGVEDFLVRQSVIEFGPEGLERVGPSAARLADLEGLHAHAAAVRLRLKG